ncbi:hypothetical protein [Gloeobacter kilaueensis]|uniref:Uncharacterized protein n=1 Tax=Gloeobacter kilaueensis (strain ATCC BAA-2537 / CCAP 1431/1 / ULC 316 / JS1) TaxID=1183438 RepID=U5QGA1_GLOK1|nr:hypothetical protein [Gloeobacter kilaueensis]AGY57946.1 hypothetical protein GKIL_1700 [Gloeobacter kilaueensis JS1]
MNAHPDHAAIVCTLDAADMQQRLARIRTLSHTALRNHRQRERTLTLHYVPAAAEEVRALVEAEQACCAFLDFALSETAAGISLVITAPTNAGEFAPMLFAHWTRVEADSPVASCGCSVPCP